MNNWIFAALGLLLASPALAAGQEETRQIKVDYSDLDITRAPGVTTLERRVKGAVRQLCGDAGVGLHQKSLQRECASEASTQAASDIDKAVERATSERSWPMSAGHRPR